MSETQIDPQKEISHWRFLYEQAINGLHRARNASNLAIQEIIDKAPRDKPCRCKSVCQFDSSRPLDALVFCRSDPTRDYSPHHKEDESK